MSGAICVLAEQWRGQLSEITFEMLALGRELADALGVPLEAVLLGCRQRHLAAALGRADSVFYVEHPALEAVVPENSAEAVAELACARSPRPSAILVPLTNISLGVGTLLGAILQAPAINFCKDLHVRDGRIEAECVLYGGKIKVRAMPAGGTAIFGIWPGARPAEAGRGGQPAAVEETEASFRRPPRIRFQRYIDPEPGDVDLTRQAALVGVGRGMQSQDNLELAEALAGALGGAVCGSRPVIDQGWLPLSRQVGKSGLTVKPKLYVAAGISGAPEHVEGMKDSEVIVAINSDPQAPIFSVAHYGIVGDALDLLPALTGAIQAKKG